MDSIEVLVKILGGLPGLGVDIEAVDRFMDPDDRLFTSEELSYCDAQADPAESRAGHWCAKEAVSKACAKYLQLTLREIELRAEPSGRPIVLLPERALAIGLAAEVSIAHTGGTAIAVALAGVRQLGTTPQGEGNGP